MYQGLVLVFLMSFLSGCAVFSGAKVPATILLDLNASSFKPTLAYSSKALGGLSEPKDMSAAVNSVIEGELLSVIEASTYFGRISRNDPAADITLDVTMINRANPAALIPAIITGLSLYIIPSWATDEFDVVAIAERQDGLKKQYMLNDSTRLVQWLPMVLAFPFNNFSVIADVRKNMYKRVLFEMEKDGFFHASNH